ncbi:MAG: transglycosylase SLT domain-containing protein [Candidatus Binataceae bacterium]
MFLGNRITVLIFTMLLAPVIAGAPAYRAAAAEVAAIAPGWEPQNRAIAALAAPAETQPAAAPASGTLAQELRARTGSPFIVSEPKTVAPFPILLNRIVQQYVNEYLNRPGTLEATFNRSRPYLPEMARVMRSYGVPEDMVYLAFAESEFSGHGRGPWQFNKVTAERYGLHVNRWVDERRDPILSTRAAAEYLADLHDAAGYDWRVAVVGWNRGDLAINRFWVMRGNNFNRFMAALPHDTRCLLGRFMAVAFIAHNAAAYGIGNVNYDAPPAYSHISVRGGATLASLARGYHTTVAHLKQLNPAILRDRVPPYARNYGIRIPLVNIASAR